jgi:hypothetical protein
LAVFTRNEEALRTSAGFGRCSAFSPTRHGRALTLEAAKAEFEANWRQWLQWAKLRELPEMAAPGN